MQVLVVGARRADSGKTTFATGLVARTDAVGFKPRAGNNRWYHYDDYLRAVTDGRLYGKDSRRLAAASAGSPDPEGINAVHRLWQPATQAGRLLGRRGIEFVLDRVGDRYVVNGTAEIPPEARDGLPLEDATVVDSLSALNGAIEAVHLPTLADLRGEIEATDRAVVESYTDVARPIRDLEPDAVAAVEPGRMRAYPGDRFVRACEVTSGSPVDGRLETRMGDVVPLLDPAATVPLPPLRAETQADPAAVGEAYADAYDALLDLVP